MLKLLINAYAAWKNKHATALCAAAAFAATAAAYPLDESHLKRVLVAVGVKAAQGDYYYPIGQGSIIRWRDGIFVLTCAHCIEVAKDRGRYAETTPPEEVTFAVKSAYGFSHARLYRVVKRELGADLALLSLASLDPLDGYAPLEVAAKEPNPGAPAFSAVTMLGRRFNGCDTEIKVRKAAVIKIGEVETIGRWGSNPHKNLSYTLSCPSMSGYSGSPVLDEEGKVVGVLNAGYTPWELSPFAESSSLTNVSSRSSAVTLSELNSFLAEPRKAEGR